MTQFYNLDAIISVGYLVNLVRATQFCRWATHVLREFAKTFAESEFEKYRIVQDRLFGLSTLAVLKTLYRELFLPIASVPQFVVTLWRDWLTDVVIGSIGEIIKAHFFFAGVSLRHTILR